MNIKARRSISPDLLVEAGKNHGPGKINPSGKYNRLDDNQINGYIVNTSNSVKSTKH